MKVTTEGFHTLPKDVQDDVLAWFEAIMPGCYVKEMDVEPDGFVAHYLHRSEIHTAPLTEDGTDIVWNTRRFDLPLHPALTGLVQA